MTQFECLAVRNLCVSFTFRVIPFPPFLAPVPSFFPLSGVIRNWTSQYER